MLKSKDLILFFPIFNLDHVSKFLRYTRRVIQFLFCSSLSVKKMFENMNNDNFSETVYIVFFSILKYYNVSDAQSKNLLD